VRFEHKGSLADADAYIGAYNKTPASNSWLNQCFFERSDSLHVVVVVVVVGDGEAISVMADTGWRSSALGPVAD
jgi:hypothetical protein